MKKKYIQNKFQEIIKKIKLSYFQWKNRRENKKKFKEFMKQIKSARNQ
jgi:hypothetical protein